MKPIYLGRLLPLIAVFALPACGPKQETQPPPPPVVLVTPATSADVPITSEAIATMDGSTNTQIHSQVTGYLTRQAYSEGSVVQPGDLLFEIDPKPFQAELDKAAASLANAQAQQKRSEQDLARYATLVKSGAVSQQEYQTELQNNLSAQANVESAQASVATAKINLGYTKITSPIEGVVGHSNVYVGDLINPSQNLTTVSTVDPIQADFTLSEQFYLDNADRFAKVSAIPMQDRPDIFQLILPDGSVYPYRGRFYYLNRQVQTSTGAFQAYALFPNPDRILRPGQYAKVRAVTQLVNNAVLIPQRSVTQLLNLNQVFVVKPDNTVEVQNVTLGDTAGTEWIVTAGLKAGERVVVEGIQKCQEGLLVTPQPYEAPPAPDQPLTNAPPVLPPPAAPAEPIPANVPATQPPGKS
jgi:RND family efflux transporter MFP subunit